MSKTQLDVNVANGVAIDVANDVLTVWWTEVYPFGLSQSKSLLHTEIQLFNNHEIILLNTIHLSTIELPEWRFQALIYPWPSEYQ